MKFEKTAKLAVTAGLCLSMAFGGAPMTAFATTATQAEQSNVNITFKTLSDGTLGFALGDQFVAISNDKGEVSDAYLNSAKIVLAGWLGVDTDKVAIEKTATGSYTYTVKDAEATEYVRVTLEGVEGVNSFQIEKGSTFAQFKAQFGPYMPSTVDGQKVNAWRLASGTETILEDGYVLSSDVTLAPVVAPNPENLVSVTVVSVDPTTNKDWSNTLQFEQGKSMAALAGHLTHENYDGYEFLGWKDSRTGLLVTAEEASQQLAAGDVTFTAVYQKTGEDSKPEEPKPEYVSATVVTVDPTANTSDSKTLQFEQGKGMSALVDYLVHGEYDGYEFLGWTDSRTGLLVTTTEASSQYASSDVTFTASYQKKGEDPKPEPGETIHATIVYTDAEGKQTDSKTLAFEQGKSMAALADYLTHEEYDGYDFLGWTDSRTGLIATDEEISSMLASSSVTFTATYQKKGEDPKPEPEDKLVSASVVTTDPTTDTFDSKILQFEQGKSMAALADYLTHEEYDGYEFLGWTDSRTGLLLTATEVSSQLATSDVTFTATYQKKGEDPKPEEKTINATVVTTDAEGKQVDSKTLAFEQGKAMSSLDDYLTHEEYDGYEFLGWKDSRTNQILTSDEISAMVASNDVTFTTVYQKKADPVTKHTVTFVDQFNKTEQTVTVEDGQSVAKPEDPSFDGYEFKGWSLNGNDENAFEAYDFSAPVNEDVTLYAWYVKKGAEGEETPGSTDKADSNKEESVKDEKKSDEKALPQTGDNSAVAIAGAALAGAAVLAAGVTMKRRQNN